MRLKRRSQSAPVDHHLPRRLALVAHDLKEDAVLVLPSRRRIRLGEQLRKEQDKQICEAAVATQAAAAHIPPLPQLLALPPQVPAPKLLPPQTSQPSQATTACWHHKQRDGRPGRLITQPWMPRCSRRSSGGPICKGPPLHICPALRTLQGRQCVALHISTTILSLLAASLSSNSSGECTWGGKVEGRRARTARVSAPSGGRREAGGRIAPRARGAEPGPSFRACSAEPAQRNLWCGASGCGPTACSAAAPALEPAAARGGGRVYSPPPPGSPAPLRWGRSGWAAASGTRGRGPRPRVELLHGAGAPRPARRPGAAAPERDGPGRCRRPGSATACAP